MKKAIALGTFDGIHKGHLSVLDLPCKYEKIAITFKIPPKCFISGVNELLLTPEDKKKRLEDLGFRVVTLDFDEVRNTSAEDFAQYIKNEFDPFMLSCGFNHRFGKDGKGDIMFLTDFCDGNNILLKMNPPVRVKNILASSSIVRDCLKRGDIQMANIILSEDFYFTAPIIHGDGRGRTLGFPTINQRYPEILVKPKFGVYKSETVINGKRYDCITNLGRRPTYPTDYVIGETFIKDFKGDLYGKNLTVTLKEFLREEKKFADFAELKRQIAKDIKELGKEK